MERKPNGYWKGKPFVFFEGYYIDNYEGLSVTEVQKVDGGFTSTLYSRSKNWVKRVFGGYMKKKPNDYWKRKPLKFFKEYYDDHYKGMCFSEVQKIDGRFASALYTRNKNWVKNIFEDYMKKRPKGYFKDKSLNFYKNFKNKNFGDKTRSQVHDLDYTFYIEVKNAGFLNSVFPEGNISWKDYSDDDLMDYYIENLEGFPISRNKGFSTEVRRRGIREDFPRFNNKGLEKKVA